MIRLDKIILKMTILECLRIINIVEKMVEVRFREKLYSKESIYEEE